MHESWTVELVELVLQLAGTLGIAFLTVRWALGRVKSDKGWERELRVYADAVQALSHLLQILSEIENDELKTVKRSDAYIAERAERWRAEVRRLSEATAMSALLLSNETANLLARALLLLRPYIGSGEDYLDHIGKQLETIKNTLPPLIEIGRRELGAAKRNWRISSDVRELTP